MALLRGNPAWMKGQSGNPKGRPKIPEDVRTLARAHTREAIETHIEIMRDKDAPPAARGASANAILDRAYGKPAQAIDATVNINTLIDARSSDLAAALLAITAQGGSDEAHPTGLAH